MCPFSHLQGKEDSDELHTQEKNFHFFFLNNNLSLAERKERNPQLLNLKFSLAKTHKKKTPLCYLEATIAKGRINQKELSRERFCKIEIQNRKERKRRKNNGEKKTEGIVWEPFPFLNYYKKILIVRMCFGKYREKWFSSFYKRKMEQKKGLFQNIICFSVNAFLKAVSENSFKHKPIFF